MNSQHTIPTPSTRRGSRSSSPESSAAGFTFLYPLEGSPQMFLTETVTRGLDDADSIAITREAIAAVPVRVTDRHGNAIDPSESPLLVLGRIPLSCTVF